MVSERSHPAAGSLSRWGTGSAPPWGAGHLGGADPVCPLLTSAHEPTGGAGRPDPPRSSPRRSDYLRVWTAKTALPTFPGLCGVRRLVVLMGAGKRPEGAMDAAKRAGEQFRQGESWRVHPRRSPRGATDAALASGENVLVRQQVLRPRLMAHIKMLPAPLPPRWRRPRNDVPRTLGSEPHVDLECSYRESNRRAVCTVVGEIDLASVHDFDHAAHDAMDAYGPRLVLDLSGVTFMAMSGIKCMLRLRSEAADRGGHLTLAGVPHLVMRLLTQTRMDRVFVIPVERPS